MGWDGSGNFNRTISWLSRAGLAILTANHETHDADLATGLENCVTRDGQNSPTADLPMASQKHLNVGNAAARNQYAAVGQAQDQSFSFVSAANVGGTADAFTLNPVPPITAYAAGQRFSFVVELANTGAATVAVSSLAAKAVQKLGAALVADDLTIGDVAEIEYDGTQFQLLSPARTGVFKAGSIATAALADDAVTTAKIGPAAITTVEMAINSQIMKDGSELTISTGSITPTANYHTVDTEADAATDDLTDIVTTNIADFGLLLIRANNTARTVVVKHTASGANKIVTVSGGDITLDDSIQSVMLQRRGDHWEEVDKNRTIVDFQEFTVGGTWNKPAAATLLLVYLVAGGGGGGGTTYSQRGGGGGGAGSFFLIPATEAGASETITVGAGGSGTTLGTGGTGGTTSFGTILSAFGGGGGVSQNSPAGGGGGGGGVLGAGSGGSVSQGGGAPTVSGAYGGGDGYNGTAGQDSVFGGGGGGSGSSGGTGGDSIYGAGGGGSTGASGGTSQFAGNGGSANNVGAFPGGGGGWGTGSSGDGGAGRAQIWAW